MVSMKDMLDCRHYVWNKSGICRATTLPLIAAVLRGDSKKCLGLNCRDAIITGDREVLLMYYCVSSPALIY